MGNSHGTQVSDEERRRYIRQMDAQMNQRFGRTSKHAVKVVVRGERETGKTTLTKLLSGGVFDPKYTQSKPGEVETVTVQWGAGPGEDVSLSMVAVAEIGKRQPCTSQLCCAAADNTIDLQTRGSRQRSRAAHRSRSHTRRRTASLDRRRPCKVAPPPPPFACRLVKLTLSCSQADAMAKHYEGCQASLPVVLLAHTLLVD
eukprot:705745-Rhodomonas_salina.2